MQVIKQDVSVRKDGKFAKVGEYEVHVPTLAEIIAIVANAKPKKADKDTAKELIDADGNEITKDGLPVYEADEADWIQKAMFAQVKAQARNKLVPETANLKPDNKIATNWEELCEEGKRGGGEHLAIAREIRAMFAEWLKKQNLAEAAQNALNIFFGNSKALAVQQPSTKEKMKAKVMAFAEATLLTPELIDRYEKSIEAVLAACEGTEDPLAGM